MPSALAFSMIEDISIMQKHTQLISPIGAYSSCVDVTISVSKRMHISIIPKYPTNFGTDILSFELLTPSMNMPLHKPKIKSMTKSTKNTIIGIKHFLKSVTKYSILFLLLILYFLD